MISSPHLSYFVDVFSDPSGFIGVCCSVLLCRFAPFRLFFFLDSFRVCCLSASGAVGHQVQVGQEEKGQQGEGQGDRCVNWEQYSTCKRGEERL